MGCPTHGDGCLRGVGKAWNKQIALVSGHAGNDSGAICEDEDGSPTILEADINAKVAQLAADLLRRAGADVAILEEYDARLRGLRADVFLSIHADSCIDVTGYKSSHYIDTTKPEIDNRLVACINSAYAAATGLTENTDTITENMTEYHAFRRIDPQTPAAILELGFLGGIMTCWCMIRKFRGKGSCRWYSLFFGGRRWRRACRSAIGMRVRSQAHLYGQGFTEIARRLPQRDTENRSAVAVCISVKPPCGSVSQDSIDVISA